MTDLSVGARPVHISASVALGQLPVPPVVAPHGSNDQAELGSAGNRGRVQGVDATIAASIAAGVWYSSVLRGLALSRAATTSRSAWL